MSEKKPLANPVWYKNTYFWIAGVLFMLSIVAIIFGDNAVRDPGQKREGGLVWVYFLASIVMLINGVLSHRQTVQLYREETEGNTK